MKYFIFILFCSTTIWAQNKVSGRVLTAEKKPITEAVIYWTGSTTKVSSNSEGYFEIERSNAHQHELQIEKNGFQSTVIMAHDAGPFEVVLLTEKALDEIVVKTQKSSLSYSLVKAQNMVNMSSKELLKAACCNLSESFETNPAIDVNFTDAITGNKQIKMLGLSSPYLFNTQENIAIGRGAAQSFGLSFIPGSWVESIQITKGAGSVVNGYESISGQINTELIKPANDVPLFINGFGSTEGRFELNTQFSQKITDKLHSSLYVHGNSRAIKNDMNEDGFLDNPLNKQINLLNRWQYQDLEKGWISFLSLHYTKDNKQAGAVNFDPKKDRNSTSIWGSELKTNKLDAFAKVGYVFPETPYQSIGLQTGFTHYNQDGYYGQSTYGIQQNSAFINLLFNSIISNTMHKFTTGFSAVLDDFNEATNRLAIASLNRKDNSLGAFFEYTYDNSDNFSVIAGIRADYHNRMGLFATPRLHVRYNPFDNTVIRFSAGKGQRLANVLVENQQVFGTNRNISILNNGGKTYGLDPEIAWNFGFNLVQNLFILNKKASLSLDLYRTQFNNQIVSDWDFSPQQLLLSNLNGKSFANTLQIDFNIQVLPQLEIRTAYKYYDVQTDYANGRLERPLQAKNRFFTNIAFENHIKTTTIKWDATYNYLGKQRLPNTISNPSNEQLPEYSNPFGTINGQVTAVFSKKMEWYMGVENATNYQQNKQILGVDAPFGNYFDSAQIYAPIFGRMFYTGFRYQL